MYTHSTLSGWMWFWFTFSDTNKIAKGDSYFLGFKTEDGSWSIDAHFFFSTFIFLSSLITLFSWESIIFWRGFFNFVFWAQRKCRLLYLGRHHAVGMSTPRDSPPIGQTPTPPPLETKRKWKTTFFRISASRYTFYLVTFLDCWGCNAQTLQLEIVKESLIRLGRPYSSRFLSNKAFCCV